MSKTVTMSTDAWRYLLSRFWGFDTAPGLGEAEEVLRWPIDRYRRASDEAWAALTEAVEVTA